MIVQINKIKANILNDTTIYLFFCVLTLGEGGPAHPEFDQEINQDCSRIVVPHRNRVRLINTTKVYQK